MVPDEAGCVGDITVEVGGIAIAVCGVFDGGIGDAVGDDGAAITLHDKIKERMIDRITNFFFMVQFDLSFDGFQNLFCSINPYHFLRYHLRGDFFNHITACTGGNRNLPRVQ